MRHYPSRIDGAMAALALGLKLPVSGASLAQPSYQVQKIITVGETAGDQVIARNRHLWVAGLSDRGHLHFIPFLPDASQGDLVLQFEDGKFTTIAVPQGDAPDGTWPEHLFLNTTVMNSRGVELFNANDARANTWRGVYRWDPDAGELSVVASEGMPASDGWSIVGAGAQLSGLSINNHDEAALLLAVSDANGTSGHGLFHIGRDGQWQPVFLPGQELPGGGRLRDDSYAWCSLNDAGAVLFLARREGERQTSAFLWEQGKLKSVLAIGTATLSSSLPKAEGSGWRQ